MGKPIHKLSQRELDQLKPAAAAYKRFDGAGLYVLVYPSGERVWKWKYRYAGKEQTLTFGRIEDVPVDEARERRVAAQKILDEGHNPAEVNKQTRLANVESARDTFKVVAEAWIEVKVWKPDYEQHVREMLERDVYPAIGERPIRLLTFDEVLAVLRRPEKRGAVYTGRRLTTHVEGIFAFAKNGRRVDEAFRGFKELLKRARGGHVPSLSAERLPDLLGKLVDDGGRPETHIALQLLIHTFVRTITLRRARWSDFDLDQRLWSHAGVQMKNGKEFLVPLTDPVIALLEQLRPLTGRREYLFPAMGKEEGILSANTINKLLHRLGFASEATGHGFRTTASTWLNENKRKYGWDRDAIERQLAHVDGSTREIYNKAEYLAERREMMRIWSAHVEKCRHEALDGVALTNYSRAA